jgi:putative glutathione S-transferase
MRCGSIRAGVIEQESRMGQLVDGVWQELMQRPGSVNGKFVRRESQIRNWITADGAPGPSGTGGFNARADRYHLYVSLACPWAHRTLIVRKLKHLEDAISVSIVDYFMATKGWEFSDRDGATPDPIFNAGAMPEIYAKSDPHYTGRASVPLLWDKQTGTAVSNESSEIIRMFNSAFDGIGKADLDLYPTHLRPEIDAINEVIYTTLNNGVYKCGFATSQAAYETAFAALFKTLDDLEQRLERQRYLVGNTITEADWRLFTTLVRFDPVYFGHFKCNKKRIADYPNLSNYLRDLYQISGVAETVDFLHIKNHYYQSHETINPTRIVPVGPDIDLTPAHDRARFDG